MNPSFKRVVEIGYDRVAERFLASKDAEDTTTLVAPEELVRELPPGAPMRWSHHDGGTSLELLHGAGFATEGAEARTTRGPRGGESWLWVLARKPLYR